MDIPENVNAGKLLTALAQTGVYGTIIGTRFLPEKPLASAQLAEVEKAIATHDPTPTRAQERQDPKVLRQEWELCRSLEAKVAYLAVLMGLQDPIEG